MGRERELKELCLAFGIIDHPCGVEVRWRLTESIDLGVICNSQWVTRLHRKCWSGVCPTSSSTDVFQSRLLLFHLHFQCKDFSYTNTLRTLCSWPNEKVPTAQKRPISLRLLTPMITRPFGYRELFIAVLKLALAGNTGLRLASEASGVA